MITCQVSALAAVMPRSRAWWWVLHQQGALWICYPIPQGRWRRRPTRNFTNNNGYAHSITLKRYVFFSFFFIPPSLSFFYVLCPQKRKRKTNPKQSSCRCHSFVFTACPVFFLLFFSLYCHYFVKLLFDSLN